MQVPFPELTELKLSLDSSFRPTIPDSFLGGSAPRLQCFELYDIPFPGLPKLLLSATHLVELSLLEIPHSGYISPEAMVTLISALSSLEILFLQFKSAHSHPDLGSRPPPTSSRFVVPALTNFHFKGVIEYLEDLVTFIDAPQLHYLSTILFGQINYDSPRFTQFINRTPKLKPRTCRAHVEFNDWGASVTLTGPVSPRSTLEIETSCKNPYPQLSSVARVCNYSLSPISTVEVLLIVYEHPNWEPWENNAMENARWLEFLLPFTVVKNLYIYTEVASGIAATLQELAGGRITEVLPSLQNIFVEGLEKFRENVGRFIEARQLSDHPIAIFDWDRDSDINFSL